MKRYALTYDELCAALATFLSSREGLPIDAADVCPIFDPDEEGIGVEVLAKPDDEG